MVGDEVVAAVGEGAGRSEEGLAPGARPKRRGYFQRRRKPCPFCVSRDAVIDYKDGDRLLRFLTDRGRIESRRKVGTCAKHQRVLAVAIKRARLLALLPFTAEHVRQAGTLPYRR